MELKPEIQKACRYRIFEALAGGSGAVYKAQDLEFRRSVCVKEIPVRNRQELQRAEDEAAAMIRAAEHTAHVPAIFDKYYDESRSAYYIVMQWINGETLRAKLKTGHLSDFAFLDYICQLCDILSKFEKDNGSHKDIKPENIMITEEGDVYLIDFGLVISVPNGTEGTAGYKAPEMETRGFSADRRSSDIFSIGVIMYEHFAKKIPERGKEYGMSRTANAAKEWSVFNDPCENPAVNAVIRKCMAYDPRARYQSARDLKNAVRKARSALGKT